MGDNLTMSESIAPCRTRQYGACY